MYGIGLEVSTSSANERRRAMGEVRRRAQTCCVRHRSQSVDIARKLTTVVQASRVRARSD